MDDMTAMQEKVGYEGCILYVMQQLELILKQELKVPALECSQLSQSFLVYVLNVLVSSAPSSSLSPERQRSCELGLTISSLFQSLQREMLLKNDNDKDDAAVVDEDTIKSDRHNVVDYRDDDIRFEEQAVVEEIIQRINNYLSQLEFESSSSNSDNTIDFSDLIRFLCELEQQSKISPSSSLSMLRVLVDLIDGDDSLKGRMIDLFGKQQQVVGGQQMHPFAHVHDENHHNLGSCKVSIYLLLLAVLCTIKVSSLIYTFV